MGNLGLVGNDPEVHYVQLAPSTQCAHAFTADDYAALVAKMFAGEITVDSNSDDSVKPVTDIAVTYNGTVK